MRSAKNLTALILEALSRHYPKRSAGREGGGGAIFADQNSTQRKGRSTKNLIFFLREGHFVFGGLVQSSVDDPFDAQLLVVVWEAGGFQDFSQGGALPLGTTDGVVLILGKGCHPDGIEGCPTVA